MEINTSSLQRRQKCQFIFTVLFLAVLFSPVKAATFYWSGVDGANWNIISNWSSTLSPFTAVTTLPGSADIVRINENSVTIPSGYAATAKYIIVTTTIDTKPSKIIVQSNGVLTCSTNNAGVGACIYLRGGAIINDGSITLNVTTGNTSYGILLENSTVTGVISESRYSGDGALNINASNQTAGGALRFTQTVATPFYKVSAFKNCTFNMAPGTWPFVVMSGSNALIKGTGTIDIGTNTNPVLSGLFKIADNNSKLTVESGVVFNCFSNGTFGADKGIVNIGNDNGNVLTNKGTINITSNGKNGVYCGSNTQVANTVLNEGSLIVDGGSAIVFGGLGSASVTNSGYLGADNLLLNTYSVGVYGSGVGLFSLTNTYTGAINLRKGLGIASQVIFNAYGSETSRFVDTYSPANVKPFLVDNLLPTTSQSYNWDVVFSDEFNDTKIDTTKWIIEKRTNYTDITVIADSNQVEEKDGNAYIYYRKSTNPNNKTYLAGRFKSQGKYSTTFGYIECRMHIVKPYGHQTAFWMMPDQVGNTAPGGVYDGTAKDGAEIDIIEGNKDLEQYSTGLHWDGYGDYHQGSGQVVSAPGLYSTEYHVFGFEWTPNFIKYYYDGKVVRTITDPVKISLVPEFIYFTGNMWGTVGWVTKSIKDYALLNSGGVDNAYIDWVRVYKNRTVPVSELPSNAIIMDNADASGVSISGSWVASSNLTGYYSTNYLHDNNQGKGTKTVSFNPSLSSEVKYEVFTRFPVDANRSPNANYIIKRALGDTTVLVNQSINPNVWVSIGTYTFNNTQNPKVIITNANSTGYVIADAVAFVPKYGVRNISKWYKDELENDVLANTQSVDNPGNENLFNISSDMNKLIVRFSAQNSKFSKIDIYNTTGMLIYSSDVIDLKTEHSKTINKPAYLKSNGLCIVKVSIDGKSVCKKLIW